MTRAEFTERLARKRSCDIQTGGFLILALLAGAAACAVAGRVWGWVALAGACPLLLLLFLLLRERSNKACDLLCPNCCRPVSRQASQVLATGLCPHCSRRILGPGPAR